MRHSEQLVQRHGLTPLQYQLLLQIRGYPLKDRATISGLAERLQAKHHGVVALATRCERLGLITRRSSTDDARVVHLCLSAKGQRMLENLARRHRGELRSLASRPIQICVNCYCAPALASRVISQHDISRNHT